MSNLVRDDKMVINESNKIYYKVNNYIHLNTYYELYLLAKLHIRLT